MEIIEFEGNLIDLSKIEAITGLLFEFEFDILLSSGNKLRVACETEKDHNGAYRLNRSEREKFANEKREEIKDLLIASRRNEKRKELKDSLDKL